MARTLIRGGTVVDGRGGEPAAADVAFEDGRIVEVGPGLDGDEAVDAAGMTVLPGLFDCHVHVTMDGPDLLRSLGQPFSYQFFRAAANLSATLDCGITTVRDAGGADLGVKTAVDDGLVEGPRMQIAITILSQTGGHNDQWVPSGCSLELVGGGHPGQPSPIVDGPEEMRRKVRELVRAGADVIKVCTSGGVLSPRDDPRHPHFRDDELLVCVTEAAAADRFVMAHAQATDGIKAAIRTGIRSVEHGIFLDDEAIAMMLERGTWLVPTLVAPHAVLEAAAGGARVPPESLRKAEEVVGHHADSFARAVAAGVRIAMGTDSGVGVHGTNLTELELMAKGGMAPLEVWRATTSSAAELMGLGDELGALEPGKRADVVLLAGDPTDLGDLKARIRGVWKDGARLR
ncbi:amidohydrolase family protein [Acidimicrobiaceae bacterium USS-CC1]|uniref:Amidohydrolase family protein n=1 Tax=Acidiferrimicrobium australe TaxID=2664430 RepID=A0ABW9QQ57_9ACTN|nr:amidohydrolase family protein [Acidiferrimicrobium australe]